MEGQIKYVYYKIIFNNQTDKIQLTYIIAVVLLNILAIPYHSLYQIGEIPFSDFINALQLNSIYEVLTMKYFKDYEKLLR